MTNGELRMHEGVEGCVRCVHESTYVREDVVGAEAVLEQGGLRGGEPELLPAAASVVSARRRRLGFLALMMMAIGSGVSGAGATSGGGVLPLLLPAARCWWPARVMMTKSLRSVTVLHRQHLAEQLHRPRRRQR